MRLRVRCGRNARTGLSSLRSVGDCDLTFGSPSQQTAVSAETGFVNSHGLRVLTRSGPRTAVGQGFARTVECRLAPGQRTFFGRSCRSDRGPCWLVCRGAAAPRQATWPLHGARRQRQRVVRLAHRKAARPSPLKSTHTFRHVLRSPGHGRRTADASAFSAGCERRSILMPRGSLFLGIPSSGVRETLADRNSVSSRYIAR